MRTENISNHWNIVDYRNWRLPNLDNLTQNQLGWSLDGLGFIFTPKKMNCFKKKTILSHVFSSKGNPQVILGYLRRISYSGFLSAVWSLGDLENSLLKSLQGCFLKWWYPQNTPKWSFLVGKPMVVGYPHLRKPPYIFAGSGGNEAFTLEIPQISKRTVRSREWDKGKTMAKHHLKKFALAQKLNTSYDSLGKSFICDSRICIKNFRLRSFDKNTMERTHHSKWWNF